MVSKHRSSHLDEKNRLYNKNPKQLWEFLTVTKGCLQKHTMKNQQQSYPGPESFYSPKLAKFFEKNSEYTACKEKDPPPLHDQRFR